MIAVTAAELVVPCEDLDETLRFFTDALGFRLDSIFPADAPSVACVSGFGVRLRLERGRDGDPGRIRLECPVPGGLGGSSRELIAPNGTRFELAARPTLVLPRLRPSLVISRAREGAAFHPGRAGMLYRDLMPDRQGGRFIASHIRIPGGGAVPDYVHYHVVRFQMIYCRRGWARVVYEDQGPPFVLAEGDCVLQPPRIRHRVLECSPGLEVVEISSPADHETHVDHDLHLPTPLRHEDRRFDGQAFVRHQPASAGWGPWRLLGFECRDTGIAAATGGLAGVRVVRVGRGGGDRANRPCRHDAELVFGFVLSGTVDLEVEGRPTEPLAKDDAFAVPAGVFHALRNGSGEFEFLEVTLPARFEAEPTA